MSNRDVLRSKMLGKTPEFRKEVVEFEGEKYEVRQPTVKARSDLFKRAMREDNKVDMMDFALWAVILNTYDNEGKLVFEEGDYNVLIEQPTGGLLDKLSEVATKLLNVEEDAKKGKN